MFFFLFSSLMFLSEFDFCYGPPHMAKQKQDDQPELTYSRYVRTQDVILKTCRRRWMIGRSGERGSGISVLAAQHDDDDDLIVIIALINSNFYWLSFELSSILLLQVVILLLYSNQYPHEGLIFWITYTHFDIMDFILPLLAFLFNPISYYFKYILGSAFEY